MKELRGSTSDRIRRGEIVASKHHREITEEEEPPAWAVKAAEGHGLGAGATRARSGE